MAVGVELNPPSSCLYDSDWSVFELFASKADVLLGGVAILACKFLPLICMAPLEAAEIAAFAHASSSNVTNPNPRHFWLTLSLGQKASVT